MDVQLKRLAAVQTDVVAAWQLRAAGWSWDMIRHAAKRGSWRTIHRGVYALNQAPLTPRQLWFAAALTTPDSVLSHASAAACYGFRPHHGRFETVTRPGSGGPRRIGAVLVRRSQTLNGATTRYHGIPITTAARTLIDLTPGLPSSRVGKMFREALRLRVTTIARIEAALGRHPGRSGTASLRELVSRYATLPYARTRSDAEARALEVLHNAGIESPRVNIRVAGEEADLVWPKRRRIVEIDGPQYHRFADEDARKQRIWEDAGFTVRRIGSQSVFDHPERLVALARS